MTTNSRQLSSLIEHSFFFKGHVCPQYLNFGIWNTIKFKVSDGVLSPSSALVAVTALSSGRVMRALVTSVETGKSVSQCFASCVLSGNGKDQPPQPVVSLRSPEAALSHSPSWRSALGASADVVKIGTGIFGLLWNVWFQHTFDFCWIRERLM